MWKGSYVTHTNEHISCFHIAIDAYVNNVRLLSFYLKLILYKYFIMCLEIEEWDLMNPNSYINL